MRGSGVRIRYRFAGKENSLALGPFPEVTLASARAKRDGARALIAEGKDPSQQKKLDKIAAANAANNTFGAIVEELLASLEESGAAEPTLSKKRWLLLSLAAPLAKRPIPADRRDPQRLHLLPLPDKRLPDHRDPRRGCDERHGRGDNGSASLDGSSQRRILVQR